MTEDEKEDVGMKVMEALEENFEIHEEKINELVSGHSKVDCEEDYSEDEDYMEDEEVVHHDHDDAMDTDKPSEEKSMEDEDPSNLERAWEILELAKNIYSKKASTSTENTRKLCDTLLALGEVSIENENYSQAVEDLSSCLEKRKDKLPGDMREIAETQYQLGVALGYHSQFDEAVKYFQDAKTKLTAMLESLKADTFSARVGEIDELESLLPQIQEKIQDTMDTKDETSGSQAKKQRRDESGFRNSNRRPRSPSSEKSKRGGSREAVRSRDRSREKDRDSERSYSPSSPPYSPSSPPYSPSSPPYSHQKQVIVLMMKPLNHQMKYLAPEFIPPLSLCLH